MAAYEWSIILPTDLGVRGIIRQGIRARTRRLPAMVENQSTRQGVRRRSSAGAQGLRSASRPVAMVPGGEVDQLIPDIARAAGFVTAGARAQTSRTIRVPEAHLLFATCPPAAGYDDYHAAIVDDNVLPKATHSTRLGVLRAMRELYALDPAVRIFRALRDVWGCLPCLCSAGHELERWTRSGRRLEPRWNDRSSLQRRRRCTSRGRKRWRHLAPPFVSPKTTQRPLGRHGNHD